MRFLILAFAVMIRYGFNFVPLVSIIDDMRFPRESNISIKQKSEEGNN